jgi:hypothetical protein
MGLVNMVLLFGRGRDKRGIKGGSFFIAILDWFFDVGKDANDGGRKAPHWASVLVLIKPQSWFLANLVAISQSFQFLGKLNLCQQPQRFFILIKSSCCSILNGSFFPVAIHVILNKSL